MCNDVLLEDIVCFFEVLNYLIIRDVWCDEVKVMMCVSELSKVYGFKYFRMIVVNVEFFFIWEILSS